LISHKIQGSHSHRHFAKHFTKWLQLHQRSHYFATAAAAAVLGTAEALPKGPLVDDLLHANGRVIDPPWSFRRKSFLGAGTHDIINDSKLVVVLCLDSLYILLIIQPCSSTQSLPS
jgi:hypothetical protein